MNTFAGAAVPPKDKITIRRHRFYHGLIVGSVMGSIASTVRPIRVLLVEDEVLISEWVAESLMAQGFAVQTASNAPDALRYLKSAPIDVLFTDVNLPGGMDGIALARRARQFMPGLPVVYTSGRMSVLDSALQVPGSLFVAKPYDPAVVGPLLANAVKVAADPVAV